MPTSDLTCHPAIRRHSEFPLSVRHSRRIHSLATATALRQLRCLARSRKALPRSGWIRFTTHREGLCCICPKPRRISIQRLESADSRDFGSLAPEGTVTRAHLPLALLRHRLKRQPQTRYSPTRLPGKSRVHHRSGFPTVAEATTSYEPTESLYDTSRCLTSP